MTEWNDQTVHEACLREIKSGGQVYVLHNEVSSIEKMCKKLEELIPEARVEFDHGQMREKDLERIMLDFYHQRFNLLVSTTIIVRRTLQTNTSCSLVQGQRRQVWLT